MNSSDTRSKNAAPKHLLTIAMLVAALLLSAVGCDRLCGFSTPEPPATHVDLLVGHNLLQSTLDGEGGLGMLRIFKEVTLGHVGNDVQAVMKKVGENSKKRASELEKMRKLEPDVSAKAPPSPIGDAIQDAATEAGKHDMLHPDGTFSVRFLFLQAQATRMVSVMAHQTAKIDGNSGRREWLEAVADEYEAYHTAIAAVVEKHSKFGGDKP